jgi:hypothetical protein
MGSAGTCFNDRKPAPLSGNYTARIADMKHLFRSVTILLAFVIATQASAQRTGPGPFAETGTGPGIVPPGGPGPSSPLHNLPAGSPGLAVAAPWWMAVPPQPYYAPPVGYYAPPVYYAPPPLGYYAPPPAYYYGPPAR